MCERRKTMRPNPFNSFKTAQRWGFRAKRHNIQVFANAITCVIVLAAQLSAQPWNTSGSNVYYIGGNVGVGTSTPAGSLDVAGTSAYFGVFGTNNTLYLRGYNSGYSQIVSASGSLFNYNDISITSNPTNANSLPGWTLDLGGALNNFGNSPPDSFTISRKPSGGSYSNIFTVLSSGKIGIGTSSPQHELQVVGTIGAKEVIVSTTGADFVFDPGYKLVPLSNVAAYIEKNHHLPDVPSAQELGQSGVSLGDMQTKLLAKVEELTLRMIEAEKERNRMKDENDELRREITDIRKQLEK